MKNSVAKNLLPKVAILGAGGLGTEMVKLLTKRPCLNLVAIADKTGYIFQKDGLNTEQLSVDLNRSKSLASIDDSVESADSIRELMSKHAKDIDAIFYALPNIPNNFLHTLTQNILASTDYTGVIVDAIKRTSALKELASLDSSLREKNVLYVAGCGATPGMLTAAVSVACQSFVEIESVKITFGVGIANWQAYRATIREDIAHLKDFSVNKVSQMTEQEIDSELEKRNGILELVNMEHADDIMLELAGICPADRVSVGGIVDTKNPKKPVSTNVEITGITYQGQKSTHKFILGDETTMAANVNGSVLGYINAALQMHNEYSVGGFKTAAELMPRFAAYPLSSFSQFVKNFKEESVKKEMLIS
ncbi:MAG: hypothetical protein SFU25_03985 [Candidatus Caenarcaniphilales bacterium]|nr:hypothetical protein [Candidatus Caenarcaniphilales bacterium]